MQVLHIFEKKTMKKFLCIALSLIFAAIFSLDAFAQIRISGFVYDDTGVTLTGVFVKEKGTTNYTMTDLSGYYSLTVSSNTSILLFSFISFKDKEEPVAGRSRIDVYMVPDDGNEAIISGGPDVENYNSLSESSYGSKQ